MGKETRIAWTDHTFNVVWGCSKVSSACRNCYAEELAGRFSGGTYWGPGTPRKTLGVDYWREPEAWNRKAEKVGVRRRVFCGSMCDLFEDHPTVEAERTKLWPLIRRTPGLDWLLLTKRAERIEAGLPEDWSGGYPNVWLGVSVESADRVGRVERLRELPAVVRFVSYEPALGPLAEALDLSGVDWVIYGGESGPRFRPHDVRWARAMRERCGTAGVAFFFKQSPGRSPGTDTLLDGELVREYPRPREVG